MSQKIFTIQHIKGKDHVWCDIDGNTSNIPFDGAITVLYFSLCGKEFPDLVETKEYDKHFTYWKECVTCSDCIIILEQAQNEHDKKIQKAIKAFKDKEDKKKPTAPPKTFSQYIRDFFRIYLFNGIEMV